jgi:ATP-binding cassette subfamily B protein
MPPNNFFNSQAVHFGYVGAESFLIEGTIADNIRYGALKSIDTSDKACLKALKRAHLDDLVTANPQILDHKINENGEGLSAGQKQRLALARALLGNPQLLILDEASANLDGETEADIAKTVSGLKGSCTTIIVTHRPGMLTYADKVLQMEKSWDKNSENHVNETAV